MWKANFYWRLIKTYLHLKYERFEFKLRQSVVFSGPMSWRGERPTLPRRRQRQPRDPYRLLVVEAITTNSTTTTRQCHLVTPSAICITQGRSIITGAPQMSQERPQIRPGVSAIFWITRLWYFLSHVSPCVVSSEWQLWLRDYFCHWQQTPLFLWTRLALSQFWWQLFG